MNKSEVAAMAQMKQQLTGLDEKLDDHIGEQRREFDEVKKAIESLAGRFANKWVEKFIIGLLIGMGITIIGLLVRLIVEGVMV